MDNREQLFGSDVGSENVFKNVALADKYKTPAEVREAIEKLLAVEPESDSDREFVEDEVIKLKNYLKFLETQE